MEKDQQQQIHSLHDNLQKIHIVRLSSLLSRVNRDREINERDANRVNKIIVRNNAIAEILSSDEFIEILEKEKELKGKCKIGEIHCIDGRNSILHQAGRSINIWEIAGSLIAVAQDNKRNHWITNRRLIGIMEDLAREPEQRDLLEIVTAHTSIKHKKHKCGKITADINSGIFSGDVDDVAKEQAELRREAFENTYNAILEHTGKKPQEQVAITAMIDNDTMGFILNFGEQNELSTTKLLMEQGLKEKLEQSSDRFGAFGSMKERFTDVNSFVDYSKKVLEVTTYLMNEERQTEGSIIEGVAQYIDSNYPKLTESQKQALLFRITRSIANQYVTGLSGEEYEHPYSEHHEGYMVVSPNGKPFGRFDIGMQSFGSTPSSRYEALDQIMIKLGILDKAKKETQNPDPDILFISTPISRAVYEQHAGTTFHAAIDSGLAYYESLLRFKEIRKRVEKGELILVPILVDEENGKVVEIQDLSLLNIISDISTK